jgi:hypothetical protein
MCDKAIGTIKHLSDSFKAVKRIIIIAAIAGHRICPQLRSQRGLIIARPSTKKHRKNKASSI